MYIYRTFEGIQYDVDTVYRHALYINSSSQCALQPRLRKNDIQISYSCDAR